MKANSLRTTLLAAMTTLGMIQLSGPAAADAPIWANAKWVKATSTTCGGIRFLILKGNKVTTPTKSNSPGCTSSEVIFVQVNVSKKFFKGGNTSEISASRVDAGYIECGDGRGIINLGAPGEAARAIREHPVPRGCTYATRQYQYVSSVGSIPFTNVANGGTMTVRESLEMHARERERAIADCNASAACRAEVSRMRSYSGSSSGSNPCEANSNYSNYNGTSRCVDINGNPDPKGNSVYPH